MSVAEFEAKAKNYQDLISYKIDRLQPSLRLNMCSQATGNHVIRYL